MLIKYCCDCSREMETEYCEICNGWVCDECDPGHDCLDEELQRLAEELDEDELYETLEGEEAEAYMDEMLDDFDEDDEGHA